MNSNHYCIIMAGGSGTRFWPVSRAAKPKQFLDILGMGKTFLRMTYFRYAQIVPVENIYVVTSEQYGELVKSQIPITDENIILEPAKRNGTAEFTDNLEQHETYALVEIDSPKEYKMFPTDNKVYAKAN